jgi:hypothetical protein
MERLRMTALSRAALRARCSRCPAGDRHWDRVAGKAYCPNCQEAIALGEAAPLMERPEQRRCSICDRAGTVRFLTFPLNHAAALELDVCSLHLADLVARKLSRHAFRQLQRQLLSLNVQTDEVFLLHNEFYDREGQALRPAETE